MCTLDYQKRLIFHGKPKPWIGVYKSIPYHTTHCMAYLYLLLLSPTFAFVIFFVQKTLRHIPPIVACLYQRTTLPIAVMYGREREAKPLEMKNIKDTTFPRIVARFGSIIYDPLELLGISIV